jgi:hypothetical protein
MWSNLPGKRAKTSCLGPGRSSKAAFSLGFPYSSVWHPICSSLGTERAKF